MVKPPFGQLGSTILRCYDWFGPFQMAKWVDGNESTIYGHHNLTKKTTCYCRSGKKIFYFTPELVKSVNSPTSFTKLLFHH